MNQTNEGHVNHLNTLVNHKVLYCSSSPGKYSICFLIYILNGETLRLTYIKHAVTLDCAEKLSSKKSGKKKHFLFASMIATMFKLFIRAH